MGLWDRVMIMIGVDTSEAENKIDRLMVKADAAVEKAKLDRAVIIQHVREAVTLMSQTWSTYRQFMNLIGAQVDTFYSALIGMTLSTVSMMLSMSAALAATGIGGAAALLIGSIAIGLNVAMISKLLVEKAEAMGMFNPATWSPQTSVQPFRGGF
jgi:hypothetical protein